MTTSEYFNRMKGYADPMASAGKPLTDEEILGYILSGMGPEYEPLVASITSRDTPVTLNSFYAYLLSAEMRIEQQATLGEIHPSANAADTRHRNGGHGGGHRGGDGRHNGGGQGDCGRRHGGNGGGRGRGNPNGGVRHGGGGPRPTCQVCGKYFHDALRCRNRFNHAFQPDEPRLRNTNIAHANNTSNNNWYFDSGAMEHLTADLDRLNFQEHYTGMDSVQVANGAGLQITHTGHSQITGSSRPLLNNILRRLGIASHDFHFSTVGLCRGRELSCRGTAIACRASISCRSSSVSWHGLALCHDSVVRRLRASYPFTDGCRSCSSPPHDDAHAHCQHQASRPY
ncbi:hypothetical protein QYE76_025706 [Lolium multiflorum]|uniref:Uncharacterized protein n=1 Tax=Lolium multiflorum TaxID=4521 RepID=A0AAD8RID3_LOLMU|nr:hypothetical protein QYE76_025706 [Lolium multiflorum]